MPIYTITPSDALFFRDARPFEAGGGHGARWPEPGIIFEALHAALHRAFPAEEGWEHRHCSGRSSQRDYADGNRNKRFGSLQTAGPFPARNGSWYFPRPLDVTAVDEKRRCQNLVPTATGTGVTNLPRPLSLVLASVAKPSKGEVATWWSKAAFEAYLGGVSLPGQVGRCADSVPASDIYDCEWTTGIGIDPETQAQDGRRLYSAEYMRLKPDFSLGVGADMPLKSGNSQNGMDQLLQAGNTIVVGGQQRACAIAKAASSMDAHLPLGPDLSTGCARVKWALLTPAIFPAIASGASRRGVQIKPHPGGWLPTWVDADSGKVLLRAGPGIAKADRKHGQVGRELDVRLVAARIPKSIAISGWSERLHLLDGAAGMEEKNGAKGARATVLAVPAGAVYYFEGPDAGVLAGLLNWHGEKRSGVVGIRNRRSSLRGEQGYGIGVCGPWSYTE